MPNNSIQTIKLGYKSLNCDEKNLLMRWNYHLSRVFLKYFEDNFEEYFENKIIDHFYVIMTIDNRFQGNKWLLISTNSYCKYGHDFAQYFGHNNRIGKSDSKK
jgi:hypothetical protein